MTTPINRVRYQQFVRQARGAGAGEVQVKRIERRGQAAIQYSARPPRSRQMLHGEWTISGKDEEAVNAEIRSFLEKLRQDFFVRRGEGLTGDAWADANQEAPVAPIVGKDEAPQA